MVSCHFCDTHNKSAGYKEDPKRKHDGTVEFTSRDAHNGVGKDNDRDPSAYKCLQVSSTCVAVFTF